MLASKRRISLYDFSNKTMRTMKKIYRILLITLIAFGTTSCEDWFDIRPGEPILEDFWKNEGDVLSVVAASYRAMNEPGFMERMIMWGELRSDNVIGTNGMSDDMRYILSLNITPSNEYTKWGDVYKIIGYCNNVIHFAPNVRNEDPNFTDAKLRNYIAEVKGIRAYCYFLLVKTFRDVPLIEEPFVDDTRSFQVAQTPSADMIDFLIADLQSIEKDAVKVRDTPEYEKGRITQNAIYALLADLFLWKNDYDNAITYCNKVLVGNTKLALETSANYNRRAFILGNSTESIFELQFSQNNIENYVVHEMYSTLGIGGRNGKNKGQLAAFNLNATNILFNNTDLRGRDAFLPSQSQAAYPIMKYIAFRQVIKKPGESVSESDYAPGGTSPNWIFYRLSDIYLMKAEALVERGTSADLIEAHAMASKTYDRANPDLAPGSLTLSTDQNVMRSIVFDERQREFIFEGKRYFDLLRRINREKSATSVVSSYMARKYEGIVDPATAKSKLSEINALYFPINKDELGYNKLLKQNPFYITNEGSGK